MHMYSTVDHRVLCQRVFACACPLAMSLPVVYACMCECKICRTCAIPGDECRKTFLHVSGHMLYIFVIVCVFVCAHTADGWQCGARGNTETLADVMSMFCAL